jgi:hypothetical protein
MRATRLRRALGVAGACLLPLSAALAPDASARPPAGYIQLSTLAFTAPSGTVTPGSIECEPGTVPLGGGVFIVSGQTVVGVHSSYPTPTGWAGEVDNSFGAPVLFVIDVVCAKKPRRYAIVQAPAAPNPSGAQSTAFADCPGRLQPVGGGARTFGASRGIDLNSSLPSVRSWRVDENNATSTASTFSVFAVCARLKGYAVVRGAAGTVPAGGQLRVTATCPVPSLPVGGGVFSSTSDLRNTISTLEPDHQDWVSIENNGSAVTSEATPYAICAGT